MFPPEEDLPFAQMRCRLQGGDSIVVRRRREAGRLRLQVLHEIAPDGVQPERPLLPADSYPRIGDGELPKSKGPCYEEIEVNSWLARGDVLTSFVPHPGTGSRSDSYETQPRLSVHRIHELRLLRPRRVGPGPLDAGRQQLLVRRGRPGQHDHL